MIQSLLLALGLIVAPITADTHAMVAGVDLLHPEVEHMHIETTAAITIFANAPARSVETSVQWICDQPRALDVDWTATVRTCSAKTSVQVGENNRR